MDKKTTVDSNPLKESKKLETDGDLTFPTTTRHQHARAASCNNTDEGRKIEVTTIQCEQFTDPSTEAFLDRLQPEENKESRAILLVGVARHNETTGRSRGKTQQENQIF